MVVRLRERAARECRRWGGRLKCRRDEMGWGVVEGPPGAAEALFAERGLDEMGWEWLKR